MTPDPVSTQARVLGLHLWVERRPWRWVPIAKKDRRRVVIQWGPGVLSVRRMNRGGPR